MMETTNQSMRLRTETFSIMKVLLCVLVVAGHLFRMNSPESAIPGNILSPVLSWLCDFIYNFHMEAFVAVSGGIFWFVKVHKAKYQNDKVFARKKIIRLLVPYALFFVLMVVPTLYACGLAYGNPVKFTLFNLALCHDVRHLWFLPMLFLCFIVVNTCHAFIERHNFMTLIILTALFFLPMPTLPFQLGNVCHYLLFFFLGYLLMKNFHEITKYFHPLVIIPTLGILIAYTFLPEELDNRFFQLMGAVLGLVFITALSFQLLNSSFSQANWFQRIGKNSFGIYLFHAMIIYLIFAFIGDKISSPAIFDIIVLPLLVIVSTFLSELTRFLNLGFMIGESKPSSKKLSV